MINELDEDVKDVTYVVQRAQHQVEKLLQTKGAAGGAAGLQRPLINRTLRPPDNCQIWTVCCLTVVMIVLMCLVIIL